MGFVFIDQWYVYLALYLREYGGRVTKNNKVEATSTPEEGKVFSKMTWKLPVQLNRKQYENLFESFDYTKKATADGDGGVEMVEGGGEGAEESGDIRRRNGERYS